MRTRTWLTTCWWTAEIIYVPLTRRAPAQPGELGYSDADVAAVMGGNWLRLLPEILPERDGES